MECSGATENVVVTVVSYFGRTTQLQNRRAGRDRVQVAESLLQNEPVVLFIFECMLVFLDPVATAPRFCN
jgi:hypothetical protein